MEESQAGEAENTCKKRERTMACIAAKCSGDGLHWNYGYTVGMMPAKIAIAAGGSD